MSTPGWKLLRRVNLADPEDMLDWFAKQTLPAKVDQMPVKRPGTDSATDGISMVVVVMVDGKPLKIDREDAPSVTLEITEGIRDREMNMTHVAIHPPIMMAIGIVGAYPYLSGAEAFSIRIREFRGLPENAVLSIFYREL